MTTLAPTVLKTTCADEIRDVKHYCHFIAAQAVTRDSHFSGFAPRANLQHVHFLSDKKPEVVLMRKSGA